MSIRLAILFEGKDERKRTAATEKEFKYDPV